MLRQGEGEPQQSAEGQGYGNGNKGEMVDPPQPLRHEHGDPLQAQQAQGAQLYDPQAYGVSVTHVDDISR